MLKTDLSTFDNSWYNHGSKLRRILWWLSNRLFLNTYVPYPSKLKVALLRTFGAKVGKGVVLKPKVNIKYPWLLEIGDYSWIGEQAWIDNFSLVSIGKNCCISQGAMLLTGNHNYKVSSFGLLTEEIILKDGVWVGAKAVVTLGVTMEQESILSVLSVLSYSTEAYGIYKGNPAVKIRNRIISS